MVAVNIGTLLFFFLGGFDKLPIVVVLEAALSILYDLVLSFASLSCLLLCGGFDGVFIVMAAVLMLSVVFCASMHRREGDSSAVSPR